MKNKLKKAWLWFKIALFTVFGVITYLLWRSLENEKTKNFKLRLEKEREDAKKRLEALDNRELVDELNKWWDRRNAKRHRR